jgi:hypothetical protein
VGISRWKYFYFLAGWFAPLSGLAGNGLCRASPYAFKVGWNVFFSTIELEHNYIGMSSFEVFLGSKRATSGLFRARRR